MSKNIVITGFIPFGGDTVNPALELAKHFDGRTFGEYTVHAVALPVSADGCGATVKAALDEYQPDYCISLGLAWGITCFHVERVAINMCDYPIPDNDGVLLQNKKIAADGPDAHFSTLPIRAIVKSLREAGVPAVASYTAGSYICNQTMYTELHHIATSGMNTKAGLIHVPYVSDMIAEKATRTPSLPFEFLAKGVEIAIQTVIAHPEDDVELLIGETN